MIAVQELTRTFDKQVAVDALSFRVAPGDVLGLVGPNGAGKTTTLRCLCGILPPTRGEVRIAGHDLLGEPIEAKREIAWFPDEPRLFDYLTARQHLEFSARLYRVEDAAERGARLLEELELTEHANKLPGELSRGMKQKLAIACGLLHSPRAVLFDEPLTGLDPRGIRGMKATIRRLAADGAAILVSSHLLHLVEELCTHLLILARGRAVFHGTLDEVRRQFAASDQPASLEEVFFRATDEAAVGGQPAGEGKVD
ncbi:MAG: ABC transporter ATP-binding protein [Verrucomicrobiales bacterium]|nr:ABC transporter ATP-binding protein [Verrucomicrobiales bacterium]